MKFKMLLETLLNNDSDKLVNQVLTGSLNKQNESDFPMLPFRANFSDVHEEAFVNVAFIVFFFTLVASAINKSKTELQSTVLYQNNVPNPPSCCDCFHCYVDGWFGATKRKLWK